MSPKPVVIEPGEPQRDGIWSARLAWAPRYHLIALIGTVLIGVLVLVELILYPQTANAIAAWSVAGFVLIVTVFFIASQAMLRRTSHSYRLLAQLIDASASGVMVSDRAGNILFANRRMADMLNISRVPDWSDIEQWVGPQGVQTLQDWRNQSVADRGPREAELVGLDSAGHRRVIRLACQPIAGAESAWRWRFQDVTAEHEIDALVDAERGKLIDLMDNATVGILAIDGEGRFEFANATFCGWLGMTPLELIQGGCHLHQFIETIGTDGPGRKALRPYEILPDRAGRNTGETSLIDPQGQHRLVAIDQIIDRDAEGGFVRARYIVRDLEPELAWQDALRLSEQRFRRMFQEAPIGILLVDGDGVIREVNQATERLFGRDAGALIGDDLSALIVRDRRDALSAALAEAMAYPARFAQITLKLAAGREASVEMFLRRVDTAGEDRAADITLIAHVIDVTDQKNLERQFAQSQKMQAVGQLAGGVAHDFNNLLTAMIGFCDLLLQRHRPGDPSFADIMQVKQNANRAANLVRQLLAFSRQQTLRPEVLDVAEVLADLAHLIRRLIGENIELSLIHGRDVGLVKVDQGQLEQVLVNLAVNARDAMTGGGRLTIRTEPHVTEGPERIGDETMPAGEWVAMTVADNGSGIPDEVLPRIFEPFFSTKEIGAGTGLGLSTVYGIVRQTGGFIRVESVAGEGSAFTIYLPRHVESASEQAAAPEEGARAVGDLTGQGRILLVEDEEAVRAFSARALRNKGYAVTEAANGEQALALFDRLETPIDLLITDVIMPGMDGPSLIAALRDRRADLKVICISGYAEERVQEGLQDRADIRFLPKPYSLKDLALAVKDELAG